jgi:hypothetical protein
MTICSLDARNPRRKLFGMGVVTGRPETVSIPGPGLR